MSKFDLPNSLKTVVKTVKSNYNSSKDLHGTIANTIGTGENARTALVYIVVRWSLIIATILSILGILNCWLFREKEKIPNITEDLRIIWAIFVPLITLALGYIFGKTHSKNQ